jgi:hypothetical protein
VPAMFAVEFLIDQQSKTDLDVFVLAPAFGSPVPFLIASRDMLVRAPGLLRDRR